MFWVIKMKDEREYIKLDKDSMWLLKELLDIKKTNCYYCEQPIKKGDKFSIFNKPTRLICDSILCMSGAIEDD